MERSAKHFLNRELLAPNVLEIDLDQRVLAELAQVASLLQEREPAEGMVEIGHGVQLRAERPKWQSDILWISQADRAGYAYFERIFQRLRIAETVSARIAHDRRIVLYAGFFVTRSRCDRLDLHVDWTGGDNDAFTFLVPISSNCHELGMTYRTLRGEPGHYDYKAGKGLVFGDHFCHSTALGQASGTTVLLSFTFGTDRMDNWARIANTAAKQGGFHCQPDGTFVSG